MNTDGPGRRSPTRATRWSVLAGLLAVAVLVLAACAAPGVGGRGSGTSGTGGTSGAAGTSPTGAGSTVGSALVEALTGRTFLSTAVTGHDLVAGSRISLEFRAPHSMHLRAGCNYLSGDFRLDDSRLSADQLAMTEMGCDKPLMQQDDWLADLLHQGMTVSLDGDHLTLATQDVRIVLLDRTVADPDRPLTGTTWILDGIIDGDTASSVPQGLTPTLRIDNGLVTFFDGMNYYGGDPSKGNVTVAPDEVRVTGDIVGTAIGCASGRTCSVDMSVLTQDFQYRIEADRLTVTGTGSMAGKGLTFHAQDDTTASPSPQPVPPTGADTTTMGPGTVAPASPAPVVTPGTATLPTGQVTGKTLPGGHDAIPPQPSPAGEPGQEPAQSAPGNPGSDVSNPLTGHSFRLIGLFTDAGGVDTRFPGATFDITFGPSSAVAHSSCGTISYPSVRYHPTDASPTVDLGEPSGPACSLGSDPSGVPSGRLMYTLQDGTLFLSTGFVGWRFEPAG
jgi:heat shock protein HslJ